MDFLSSPTLCFAKSRGYRRRSRPARRSRRTGTTDLSTTERVDGKRPSNMEMSKMPTAPNLSTEDSSIVIIFPVPQILTMHWLLRTAPVVLARHLVYARGLWPISVPQLMLQLRQQENNERRAQRAYCINSNDDSDSKNQISVNTKRRRLNNSSRTNLSLRKKQQRAIDQITRLNNEWARYADAATDASERLSPLPPSLNLPTRSYHQQTPRFVLISLGSSYGQGSELFLLDFQSLIHEEHTCGSIKNDCRRLTKKQQEKFERILTQKLVSVLMKETDDDEGPSLANSLPAPTSSSFRLWVTAGFENKYTSGGFQEPISSKNVGKTGCVPRPMDETGCSSLPSSPSPLSTVTWIPRTKFPLLKQKSKSRASSRKNSIITIRFSRGQKDQQSKCETNGNDNENARCVRNSNAKKLLFPTSDQVSWMSLSTYLTGFRL